MKIYTKGGDKGKTSLLNGKRVKKYNDRIECYGTLDELNSFIGVIRDDIYKRKIKNNTLFQNLKNVLLFNKEYDKLSDIDNFLIDIQKNIFIIESRLSTDNDKYLNKLDKIENKNIENIESEIDRMESELPILNNFILPGSGVSHCHVARTITRRSERIIVKLSEKEFVEEIIIKYINRLSDYFFVLSRYLTKLYGTNEIKWI